MRASGRATLAAILCAAGMSLILTPTLNASPRSTTERSAAPEQDFSAQSLEQFAAATLEIRRIGESYRPQLEAASSEVERRTLESQAVNEMVQAVNETGLSVESYNEIRRAALADPKLADRINDYLRKSQ